MSWVDFSSAHDLAHEALGVLEIAKVAFQGHLTPPGGCELYDVAVEPPDRYSDDRQFCLWCEFFHGNGLIVVSLPIVIASMSRMWISDGLYSRPNDSSHIVLFVMRPPTGIGSMYMPWIDQSMSAIELDMSVSRVFIASFTLFCRYDQ